VSSGEGSGLLGWELSDTGGIDLKFFVGSFDFSNDTLCFELSGNFSCEGVLVFSGFLDLVDLFHIGDVDSNSDFEDVSAIETAAAAAFEFESDERWVNAVDSSERLNKSFFGILEVRSGGEFHGHSEFTCGCGCRGWVASVGVSGGVGVDIHDVVTFCVELGVQVASRLNKSRAGCNTLADARAFASDIAVCPRLLAAHVLGSSCLAFAVMGNHTFSGGIETAAGMGTDIRGEN